jgi:hypothetical protein
VNRIQIDTTISPENYVKSFRSHPFLPLALCVALSFAGAAAPSHAAVDAPTNPLDWSQAAPSAQDNLPVLNRALVPAAQPSVEGKAAGRTATKRTAKSGTTKASKGLFALEDRAIIIVGGRNTTAGEVKRALQRELVAKAGAPKIVKGGARKLDLAADVGAGPKPFPAGGIGAYLKPTPATVKPVATTATPSASQVAQTVRPGVAQSIAGNKQAVSLASLRCPDNGLPKILEVGGKLKAGGKATVSGQCFGDRPGRVEIIGQFPGGKLALAFTAWEPNTVELEIPATIRGAPDHIVSVTVVTVDGKASPAMQAQFVAARERIEVPERLWSPAADFDFSATAETSRLIDPNEVNEAYAGHTPKTVRVQPQCTLDTMDAIVHSGSISQVRGWEEGPPNEASVTIDWLGTCTDTKTTTSYYYGIVEGAQDISIKSACRVAFQARAWAYCPAGIAP